MRVAIVGGGIAGLATALALHEVGYRVEVFERRTAPPKGEGLFRTLAANGLRVLDQLGALPAVLARDTVETPELVFKSSSGKVLGRAPNGSLPGKSGAITLMRGDLLAALEEEVDRRGIPLHYGHGVARLAMGPRSGRIKFTLGTRTDADLVVGADGIHSVVRGVIAPEAPGPAETGLVNVGGRCRPEGVAPTPGEMRMLWGRRAFMGYSVTHGGEGWWFANVAGVAGEGEGWREHLLQLFAKDPPFATRMIAATETLHAYPIVDLPPQPTWQVGRAVLVGDAAHAVSPSTGQGASLALEDALVLARALVRAGSPEEGLRRFVELRRPRAERLFREGRRRGAYKAPSSDLAMRVRDALMPLALRLFASERSLRWIHDYEVEWPPAMSRMLPTARVS